MVGGWVVHSCASVAVTVERGRRHCEVLEIPAPHGPYRVCDLGHKEPATLPTCRCILTCILHVSMLVA